MTLSSKTRSILRVAQLAPKKSLGQNFLISEAVLEEIIIAADLKKTDAVVEIGPGMGTLTRELCARAESVITYELDQRMIPLVQGNCKEFSNLEIRLQDALTFSPPTSEWKLVANIPYYLTGKLFRHILYLENQPSRIVLLLPSEIVERILETDGKSTMLSLLVATLGTAREVVRVPASCFVPEPRIESAVLSIKMFSQMELSSEILREFFDFLRSMYQGSRKMLRKNLKNLKYSDEQITRLEMSFDLSQRPGDLSLSEWINLYQKLVS